MFLSSLGFSDETILGTHTRGAGIPHGEEQPPPHTLNPRFSLSSRPRVRLYRVQTSTGQQNRTVLHSGFFFNFNLVPFRSSPRFTSRAATTHTQAQLLHCLAFLSLSPPLSSRRGRAAYFTPRLVFYSTRRDTDFLSLSFSLFPFNSSPSSSSSSSLCFSSSSL